MRGGTEERGGQLPHVSRRRGERGKDGVGRGNRKRLGSNGCRKGGSGVGMKPRGQVDPRMRATVCA